MAPAQRFPLSRGERRLLVVLAILTVTTFGTGFGILGPVFLGGLPPWIAVILGSLAGALFGLGTTWFVDFIWQWAGGFANGVAMQQAIRAQKLPADADPRLWSILLDRQEKDTRRTVLYVAFFATAAVLYLAAAVNGESGMSGWWSWAGFIAFTAVAIYTPFDSRSRRRRIRVLRSQLPPTHDVDTIAR